MNGVNMMLKSMGIDPDKIREELSGVLTSAQQAVTKNVDELRADICTCTNIERANNAVVNDLIVRCNRIELMLDVILKHHNIGVGGGLDTHFVDVNQSGEAEQVLVTKG